jgi:3-oxoacyl-ACP reductase-like protein
MRILKLTFIAFAAATLIGCSFGASNDEPRTAAPTQTPATAPVAATDPATSPVTTAAPAAAAPATPTPRVITETFGAHIDASAFLNALVESGCQIDKAEYKEVKRGGAIKVICSKSIDALNVELEDL